MEYSIGDIPREGDIHLQIVVSDYRLYETTLTRTRSGAWMVTENGAHLFRTDSESEAVARFLKLVAEKRDI